MINNEDVIIRKVHVSGYFKFTKRGKKFWVSPHTRILRKISADQQLPQATLLPSMTRKGRHKDEKIKNTLQE